MGLSNKSLAIISGKRHKDRLKQLMNYKYQNFD